MVSRIGLVVCVAALAGAPAVPAQTTFGLGGGLGRLHQRNAFVGDHMTDAVGVVSGRLNWPVTPTLEAGVLGQLSFGVGGQRGSQRVHTAAALAGIGTASPRAGP